MAERSVGGHAPLERVAALDGLRGAAVLAVVLFHSDRLQGGFLGVDLFFVLSGFLITGLLCSEWRSSGRIDLAAFWVRRARRLLPALLLALCGIALYAALFAKPTDLATIRADGLATLAYVANIRSIVIGHGYWDSYARSPLEHTWSLAIEEQFYLVWPLVVWCTLRVFATRRAVIGVAVVGAALSSALMVRWSYAGVDPSRLYLGTDTRVGGLLLGAALAAALAGSGPVRHRVAARLIEGAGLVGVAGLALAWFRADGTGAWIYRGGLLWCGLAAVAVIAACSAIERGVVARLFEFAPLRGLGLISYGVYLWHWPVNFVVTTTRTGLEEWALFAVRAAVTLAIALASYHWVEMPIRRGALSGRRAGFALAGAMAAAVAAVVLTTAGARSREVALPAMAAATGAGGGGFGSGIVVPSAAAQAAQAAQAASVEQAASVDAVTQPVDETTVLGEAVAADYALLTNRCVVDQVPDVATRPTGRRPRLLVVGDSVACYVGAALEVGQRGYGFQVLNRAELGCLLARPLAMRNQWEEPRAACADRWPAAVRVFDPDVSVLLAGGLAPEPFDIGEGGWSEPCDPAYGRWYEAAARRAVALLGATGGRVVLVSLSHLPDHVDIGPGIEIPERYQRWTSCLNRSLRAVAAASPRVDYLDLDAYICPRGECHDEIDGVVLREDGRHFEGAAADLVARWMTLRIKALLEPDRSLASVAPDRAQLRASLAGRPSPPRGRATRP